MSKRNNEDPIISAECQQLLEIYKLFVHTAEGVRERRDRTSQILIALIIAIASGSVALMTEGRAIVMNYCLALVSSAMIVVVSALWLSSALAFRAQLRVKRKVLMDMERSGLVYHPFIQERKIARYGFMESVAPHAHTVGSVVILLVSLFVFVHAAMNCFASLATRL